jgi:hypothetical protein
MIGFFRVQTQKKWANTLCIDPIYIIIKEKIYLPVLPNPPSPRSVDDNSSDSTNCTAG